MTTLAEQTAFREDLTALTTLAIADLVRELRNIGTMPAKSAASLTREVTVVLAAQYATDATVLAADFYETARNTALGAAAGSYVASLMPDLPEDVVQEALGWALAPLFSPNLNPADTLPRVAGKLQALTLESARKTVEMNSAQDPIGTKYARVAREDACAFCRMLSTRSAAYKSASSALFVVGEIDPRDPWRRDVARGPRGTQAAGEKFHDNCRCDVVAIFPDAAHDVPDHVAEFGSQYEAASQGIRPTRENLPLILARWREMYGAS